MSKNLLIIFTRNPEIGKVKTRLAETIGRKNALEIYNTLLFRTEKAVREIDCDKAVYYSDEIGENDIWNGSIYKKHRQEGSNLGERMLNAFCKAFNDKYKKVIIIGSDLYDLQSIHVNKAFDALSKYDFTLGPAKDGGYYLLGMKSLYSNVFKNKSWGTATVFDDTMSDLKNKSVFLLETLNDIDVYDDIKNIGEFKKFVR